MKTLRRPNPVALFGAVLASLALAGTTLAATWSPPAELSTSDFPSSPDLITLSSTSVVAAYVEEGPPDQIDIRRSLDGGLSWLPAVHYGAGMFPALAGNGLDVDLVYNNENGRVRYAHSDDGGQTFDPSIALSPQGRFAWRPAVARGADGTVVVLYEDVQNGNVAARVSTNGGTTFGSAEILNASGDESGLAAAVGEGVIYAAYTVEFGRVRVKRSFDGGASWSGATVITNNQDFQGLSMVAAGDHAYIAWVGPNDFPNFFQTRYRRTVNSGNTWTATIDLAPDNWTTYEPDLGLAGGVLRAAFTRCTPEFDICEFDRVFYRQSSNGTSWSAPQRVSQTSLFFAFDSAVGSHRAVVAYLGEDNTSVRVFARTRVPSP